MLLAKKDPELAEILVKLGGDPSLGGDEKLRLEFAMRVDAQFSDLWEQVERLSNDVLELQAMVGATGGVIPRTGNS